MVSKTISLECGVRASTMLFCFLNKKCQTVVIRMCNLCIFCHILIDANPWSITQEVLGIPKMRCEMLEIEVLQ